jgi:hypothetical protein
LRRVLTQAAFGAVKARNSRFRVYYLRVRRRRGSQVAIVAVARKLLTIMHHLLLTGKNYVDGGSMDGGITVPEPRIPKETINEAVTLLKTLGYQIVMVNR